jgi:POT family proton-dependent oligopeptide transporter
VPTSSAAAPPRRFLGEPWPLAYLAFTEAWERFSYYGMTGILVLYMTQALLLPPRVQGVVLLPAVRHGLASVFGPTDTIGLASELHGLYAAFIYFTPVLGGLLADRGLGRRRAVMLGAILMCAGHFAMAFDASFLLALALLVVGCGLLKGNISSQVGELYDQGDAEGRTRGFVIFSTGINIGAIGGPLVCGLLAQVYGWHVAFGIAGLLMLLGLATYLAGYPTLPAGRPPGPPVPGTATSDGRVARISIGLAVVAGITIFQSVAYNQNSNIGRVWNAGAVDLRLLGLHVPVAWFNSIDPAVSVACVPLLFALWRWQARHGGEPGDLGKIATGACIAMVANLLLVLGCVTGGQRVSVLWPLGYDMLLGIAFNYYWPTLLALVSRAAPARAKATFMGAVFLSLFVSNAIDGWLGRFYDRVPPAQFWLLHAAIAATGLALALVLRRPVAWALRPATGE